MGDRNFFAELKQRKLVQWTLAYVAAAFALLQGVDIVASRFGWPEQTMRFVIIALSIGFFVTLVVAWYHGERGAQRVTGTELLILALLLAIGGGILWRFAGVSRDTTVAPITVPSSNAASSAPALSPIPEKSIAVLPFDNLSEDKGNAFFAEGVQDEILTRLAKAADLKVISRTSTQRFKSTPADLREIAKQLGVMHIVEGSVQKANDQVRVNVQLINAMTDAHLWADTFDRKLTDIFAVESEIAHTIADTLQAKLTGAEKQMMAAQPTNNTEAYQLYLKGRFFWNKRTPGDLTKSVEYFNQAVAKDPNYALAYSGMADAYVLYPDYGIGSPAEFNQKAKEMALKALSLNSSLGAPHAALGAVYTNWDRDFPKAIAEFQRAIELDPNYATARQWFTTTLGATLQFDRAIAESKKANELDPLSLIVNSDLAINYINAHRFDEALAQARKTLEIDPGFRVARGYLGLALQFKGQLKEALPEFRAGVSEPYSQSLLGQACARAGLRDEAKKILASLEQQSSTHFVTGYSIAVIKLALGDKDGAIKGLQTAAEQHASEILTIQSDPLFADLHGDPRFEAFVKQIFGPKK